MAKKYKLETEKSNFEEMYFLDAGKKISSWVPAMRTLHATVV